MIGMLTVPLFVHVNVVIVVVIFIAVVVVRGHIRECRVRCGRRRDRCGSEVKGRAEVK